MTFQLGSYLTDILVLSIVNVGDTYGYEISQQIKQIVNLRESTLYPVLRRLQEAGFMETYDQSFQGRNRKYYHITQSGKEQHELDIENWKEYREAVETVIMRREEDESR